MLDIGLKALDATTCCRGPEDLCRSHLSGALPYDIGGPQVCVTSDGCTVNSVGFHRIQDITGAVDQG